MKKTKVGMDIKDVPGSLIIWGVEKDARKPPQHRRKVSCDIHTNGALKKAELKFHFILRK
jgi:hypothetical protein